jgi:hypothetical protein
MVYHYCNLESFFKIINSKELFLFNAANMNDRLETTWIFHVINEEIGKRKESLMQENIKMLETSFNLNRLYPYIFCFAVSDDSLGQWRAYANDGKGIAIGFNPEKIGLQNIIPVNTAIKENAIGYFNCIYNINTQREIISEKLDKLCFLISQNKIQQIDYANTAISLNRLSVVFKNPCFAEEQEIRIIHIPMVMGDQENNTILLSSISDINFIVKGKNISSYFKLDLRERFNSDLIPEIILGPKNYMNTAELNTYLSVNSLKRTVIKRSKASYI